MKSQGKISLRQLGRLLLLPMTLVARPARSEAEQETQILLGGQAVIEGVLMRAPRSYCVAVRTSSRGIVEQRGTLRSPALNNRPGRLRSYPHRGFHPRRPARRSPLRPRRPPLTR